MSALSTWTEFLSQHKRALVGGDLEHIEYPEGAFRGPIDDLIIARETLIVVSPWVARIAINPQGLPIGEAWEKVTRPGAERAEYSIVDEILSDPQPIGEGRFHFTYAFARITIFPKGGSKLDPRRVRGL